MAKFRHSGLPFGSVGDDAATAGTDRASIISLLKGILTKSVTPSAIPAGTNNIGDVDVASIAAGDNNIGNVDVVTLPALATGTNTVGAVKNAGPNWTKAHTHVASADASAGVELSAAPTAGQKIVLVGLVISTTTALTITVEDETAGTDQLVFIVPANSQPIRLENLFLKLPVADKKLILKTSGAGQIYATATYFSEA